MQPPFPDFPVDHLFATDYRTTHAAFLAVAAQLGQPVSVTLPASGPGGETLATDLVWLGDPASSRVLVLISGTHGVEGLAGSAIQQDFLQQASSKGWQPPAGMAVLMIHLLNPWGCAWLRRCEQTGVDLNRNFVDFSRPLPDNPGYQQIRDSLLFADKVSRQQAMEHFRQQYGQTALDIAISGGQYQDPAGPYYGGKEKTFARQLIEKLIEEHGLHNKKLAVIDLHTGLGPYGYGEIICDHPPESDGTRTAWRWYGDAVTLPAAGSSSSAPKWGLMDYGWHAIMRSGSCFVTLEFGSYSRDRLFQVLLADHQLYAKGAVDWQATNARAVSAAMREHFCPAAQAWRQRVIWQARLTISQAIEGLDE